MSLNDDLRQLRATLARQEGVEPYFVLHNKTIEEIVRRTPQTADDLAGVKGLGPKKITKYGAAIMAVIKREAPPQPSAEQPDTVLTVATYIARLNDTLAGQAARLRGEVGKISLRENVVYFDFRDPSGEAVMSCLVFASRYRLMGVELREGLDVIISGLPSVWPRNGRLSFRAVTIELVGEGKLQQAYAALKRQFETVGLFAPERKRAIPRYAERIGLITSAHGDALFDFTSNLARVGLTVEFLDCRVEGARAVPELVAALEHYNSRDVEVVVLVRGGGSWESLQAFNNEAVCRAIAASRAPVLAGIGHERDVPLAALVADRYVSTPTATAVLLSQPWQEARLLVNNTAAVVRNRLAETIADQRHQLPAAAAAVARATLTPVREARQRIRFAAVRIQGRFFAVLRQWPTTVARVAAALAALRERLSHNRQLVTAAKERLTVRLAADLARAPSALAQLQQQVVARNPERLLGLGYSIVRRGGQLVRTRRQLTPGDRVALQFGDGHAGGTITDVTP